MLKLAKGDFKGAWDAIGDGAKETFGNVSANFKTMGNIVSEGAGAIADNVKSAVKMIDALYEGASPERIEQLKKGTAGLIAANEEAIKVAERMSAEDQRLNELLKERDSILASMETPLQKYEQAQLRILDLRRQMVLTEEEATRALASSREQYEAYTQTTVDALYSGLLTQEEMIRQSYERRHAAILDSTLLNETQKNDLIGRLDADRDKRMLDLQMATSAASVSLYSDLFNSLGNLYQGHGKETSKYYKAMFTLSKSFALADSIMKIGQGIANSAKIGFPQNIVTIAGHMATTAGIISSIKSVNFAGKFANGGHIPAGKYGLVGETGQPEIVSGPANVTGVKDTAKLLGGGGNHYHYHVGTLVADEHGLKDLVRRTAKYQVAEQQRVGR
jgi:hypothetical protein